MSLDHLLHCPACGPFGLRRRRRAADADAAGHIAWAHNLLAPEPLLTEDQRARLRANLAAPTPTAETYAYWDRVLRADLAASVAEAMALDQLRDHLGTEVTRARGVIEEMRCKACPEYVGPHLKGYCAHAQLEAYNTADIAAEVVGDLTYEEQSEMFGDPIADVIRRETE